jgi:hypothetical protein
MIINYYSMSYNHMRPSIVGVCVVCSCGLWFGYKYVKETIMHEMSDMIIKTLNKKEIRTEVDIMSKHLVVELAKDLRVIKEIETALESIVETPEFQERITQLLNKLYEDKDFLKRTQGFLIKVISDPKIKEQLTSTLKGSANDLLDNDVLKKQTQDALWSVVKGSITPKLFRSNNGQCQ